LGLLGFTDSTPRISLQRIRETSPQNIGIHVDLESHSITKEYVCRRNNGPVLDLLADAR
jgi:hypothetical protein